METETMQIPIEWILGIITGLGTCITLLAGIIFTQLNARIKKQDCLIGKQDGVIGKLQDDIDRLSKGCGIGSCLWKDRK